jgi:steroid delta-isomerase-like uncharacterized protein
MGETMTEAVQQHYRNVAEGAWERDRHLMASGVVTVDPGAGRIEGIDAFLAFEAAFHDAFPDGHMEISHIIEAGETVASEGAFTGTHTGPLAGPSGTIEATGKSLRLPFADFFRFSNGQIVEHHIYYDQITFLTQLGLMPPS